MAKVSVIVISRNERFLPQTVKDVLEKATGDVECIAILDGYWPNPPLPDDPRLIQVHRGRAMGLRAAVNAGVAVARGKYVLKTDAHCLFGQGYDEVLQKDCADNWIVIPSRYSLDGENWCILNTGKARVDYHYLSFPYPIGPGSGLHGVPWTERARQHKAPQYDVDEELSFQGSAWFCEREYYLKLGGLTEEIYGSFMGEPGELGNKAWLSGGKVMTNKKTFYAHLHKGKQYGRGYPFPHGERDKYSQIGSQYWMEDKWPGQIYKMRWLIERFWPVPTWPADALERWDYYVKNRCAR